MQNALDAAPGSRHFPSLEGEFQILGINEDGHQSQNTLMVDQADLPWLQDLVHDDGQRHVWNDLWDVTYRDVQVVGRDGEIVGIYNLTENDLAFATNFDALFDIFLTAAATPQESPWQSPIEPFDVNDNRLVNAQDALIAINVLNDGQSGALSGTPDSDRYLDVTGDGQLGPVDPLRIINYLNRLSESAQAASSSSAVVEDSPAPRDYVFATYADDVDDDEDE